MQICWVKQRGQHTRSPKIDTQHMTPFTCKEKIVGCYTLYSEDFFSSVYFKMTQRYQAQVNISNTQDS